MIVIYHANQTYHVDKGFIASCALDQGVSFFFVLSGFILFYSYPVLESKRQVADFLFARFARIWPVHIFSALIFVAIVKGCWWFPIGAKFPWITLSNVCLIQSWIPDVSSYFSFNAPSWSVSVEWFFYLMFPLLISNWSKTWLIKLGGSAVAVIMLVFICNYLRLHSHIPIGSLYHAVLYTNPVCRLFEFVLGMSTAHVFMTMRKMHISRTTATLLEILCLSGVLLNLTLAPSLFSPLVKSVKPFFHWFQHTSGAPFFACFIGVIALERGAISRALLKRPLMFLGEASYSMYLLHWLILKFFMDYYIVTGWRTWRVYLLYSFCLITLSIASYLFLESPSRKYLKKSLSNGYSKLLQVLSNKYGKPA
jgi:peptidoglycan/LPS O-acetylase OafA/YrhL